MGLGNRLYGVLGLAFLLGVAGCSNDASPDDPTVLGVPPETAYLGVEYSYNFGAYGGDDILDFSLVNAPSWLGFEDTANKARTGVILRGVPGITGGRNGEDDLGTYSNISVNATDGSRLGGNVFEIKVEHNPLAVADVDYTEGESYLPQAAKDVLERAKDADFDPEEDSVCMPPDMDAKGEYSALYPFRDTAGDVFEESRTYPTYPVLVPITLGQPSVEPVTVAYQISSTYRDTCKAEDGTDITGVDCSYSESNQEVARVGWDVVASSGSLEKPSYLTYLEDDPSVGTVTFEPGKTTCFIRLEIVDDGLPELLEDFRLDLVEIRDGLASFEEGAEVDRTAALRITDDEAHVSFSPSEFIVSEGGERKVTVTLNKVNDEKDLYVKVIHDDRRSTAAADDFRLSDGGLVRIPAGDTEATFTVTALNNTPEGPDPADPDAPYEDRPDQLDEVIVLIPDLQEQFGREDYAGAADAKAEAAINEWAEAKTAINKWYETVAPDARFTPTSIVSGSFGELFVGGTLGGEAGVVWMLDRMGRYGIDSTIVPADGLLFASPEGLRASSPIIAFNGRTEQVNNESTEVRDIALGYTIESGAKGGTDIGISYFQLRPSDDDAAAPGWEMVPQWDEQLGSAGNDHLIDLAIDGAAGIVFGANTSNNWGQIDSQVIGNGDFAIGELNTTGTTDKTASLSWGRILGTTGADHLKASPITPGGTAFPVGETRGQFDTGVTQFGGSDLFFIQSDGTRAEEVYQLGTGENDTVSDAAYINGSVWATGVSTTPYEVTSEGTVNPGTAAGATNAYVLVLSGLNGAVSSISLTDENNHVVNAIAGADDFGVIGGQTVNGPGFLASVSFQDESAETDDTEDEEDPVRKMQENWRYQLPVSGTNVIDVTVSPNGKIFALVEKGSGHSIILLDDQGKRLDN